MLAIHNPHLLEHLAREVANAFAKLSKCQQFTTDTNDTNINTKLQTLLQSYQNVSNSQLLEHFKSRKTCCKRFCKVIKMLAIHNLLKVVALRIRVANAFAKLSKCQQFTTKYFATSKSSMLQTLLQSYQNVSNSQLELAVFRYKSGCKRFCKVIKMLAIHNPASWVVQRSLVANAFAKLSKCQQFTTQKVRRCSWTLLQTLLQSYQNVSNSQLFFH